MRETHLTIPELGLIGATRAALGAGLALLLGHRLPAADRKTLGWALLLIGAVSTTPLAINVLRKSRSVSEEGRWEEGDRVPPPNAHRPSPRPHSRTG